MELVWTDYSGTNVGKTLYSCEQEVSHVEKSRIEPADM